MPKKKKKPSFTEEIYNIEFCNYTVRIIYADDPYYFRNNEFARAFPSFGIDTSTDWVAIHLTEFTNYPRQSFIILPRKIKPQVLIHELTHVVDRMIDYFGFEGTEIRAYLLEYFYSKTLGDKVSASKRQIGRRKT